MKTSLSAAALLVALSASAAHAGDLTTKELLSIAKAAYPGELCWWERAEENLDQAASWSLTYRAPYEDEADPKRLVILHKLPCFYGAYNFGEVWFVETEYEGLMPLHFAEPQLDIEYADDEETAVAAMTITGFTTQPALINAEFDEETRTITSYSKWRGLGDAFSSGTWTFREGKFVLTHYEVDATFNDEIDPVTVFGDDN